MMLFPPSSPTIEFENSQDEDFVPITNPSYIKHMPSPAPPSLASSAYRNQYKINKNP